MVKYAKKALHSPCGLPNEYKLHTDYARWKKPQVLYFLKILKNACVIKSFWQDMLIKLSAKHVSLLF